MRIRLCCSLAAFWAVAALADPPANFDPAVAFGARPSVLDLRLSPDGTRVVYVVPRGTRGSAVMTSSLEPNAKPRLAAIADGTPDRVRGCAWAANDRVVCELYGITKAPEPLAFWRQLAFDVDGRNPRLLGKRTNSYTRGIALGDAVIIDWLPDQQGSVLMSRVTLPDDHLGSRIGSSIQGVGVDVVDTRTLEAKAIEPPKREAELYISDGRGNVRLVGFRVGLGATGDDSGTTTFEYRTKGSKAWQRLGNYDYIQRVGFLPVAVDPDLDVAYGFRKKDGRMALYSVALDGSLKETLVYARDDVDVDDLLRVGRRDRVIGVSYATDYRSAFYIDPAFQKIADMLGKALPTHPALRIIDSSVDEGKLLVFASRDDDAGVYHIFDRATRQLQTFLVKRDALEGVTLAKMKPVTFPATDGTPIPGYLTLPPGVTEPKGLPAIVLPHGGPSDRDEWGFSWLPQFFAARGYVVLQPNFRGSAGYGDEWFKKNGFQSWPAAIGDVLDAGRWLASQGIAAPDKIAVMGWGYGGYAALQSAVTDAGIFKAVVAVAPVTDLVALKEQHREWTDFTIVSRFIGEGPHVREGSPAKNAGKIKVPVLLFHGTMDVDFAYGQSVLMDKSLSAVNARHEFVTFEGLDHVLDDSAARTELLRKSDAFLRAALGL